jgi:hypothetical protein
MKLDGLGAGRDEAETPELLVFRDRFPLAGDGGGGALETDARESAVADWPAFDCG